MWDRDADDVAEEMRRSRKDAREGVTSGERSQIPVPESHMLGMLATQKMKTRMLVRHKLDVFIIPVVADNLVQIRRLGTSRP
eukprot:SAG31_NODE_35_length_31836_cov_10.841352_39_plen_82_part_00